MPHSHLPDDLVRPGDTSLNTQATKQSLPNNQTWSPASWGLHEITVDDPDNFNFVSGDVMVMEPHSGSTAGHVAGYDGKNWISDFVQRDFWAGSKYRKEKPHYAVYRY